MFLVADLIQCDMIPWIQRFLEERTAYLAAHKIETPYLFANPKTGAPYVSNTIRRIKEQIERETGVNFKLKDFRSTYATLTYKHSPEEKEAINQQMRHESSKTTERYYISKDRRDATRRLKDEWKKSKIE